MQNVTTESILIVKSKLYSTNKSLENCNENISNVFNALNYCSRLQSRIVNNHMI